MLPQMPQMPQEPQLPQNTKPLPVTPNTLNAQNASNILQQIVQQSGDSKINNKQQSLSTSMNSNMPEEKRELPTVKLSFSLEDGEDYEHIKDSYDKLLSERVVNDGTMTQSEVELFNSKTMSEKILYAIDKSIKVNSKELNFEKRSKDEFRQYCKQFYDTNFLDQKNEHEKVMSYENFLLVAERFIANDPEYVPNDEQYGMLINLSPRLLVQALAGTGKTEWLTRSLALRQLVFDIKPQEILGLSLTNKAADMLTNRYSRLLSRYDAKDSSGYQGTRFQTIHAFGSRLLEILQPNMKKIIKGKQTELITQVEEEPDYEDDEDDFGGFVSYEEVSTFVNPDYYIRQAINQLGFKRNLDISLIEEMLKTIEEKFLYKASLVKDKDITEIDLAPYIDKDALVMSKVEESIKIEELLKIYVVVKLLHKKDYVMTYTEMLTGLYEFLTSLNSLNDLAKYHNHEVLHHYLCLKEIVIDECQDTNPLQEAIINELLRLNPSASLIQVGDVFQSIYGFAGSTPELMLNFEYRHKLLSPQLNTSVTFLIENRRSYDEIIDMGNHILKNQKETFKVLMKGTKGKSGKPVSIIPNTKLLNDMIISDAKNRLASGRVETDITVLYRENVQAHSLLLRLIKEKILFSYKGPNPLESKEVTLIENLFGLMMRPSSTEVYTETLPYLFDITESDAKKIAEQVNIFNRKLDRGDKKAVFTNFYSPSIREKERLDSFKNAYRLFALKGQVPACLELLYSLVKSSSKVVNKKSDLDMNKFKSSIEYLTDYPAGDKFFVQLHADRKWFKDSSMMTPGVHLSTVHSYKGDERQKVYGLYISDQTSPKASELEKLTDAQKIAYIKEERNILYVLATRAVEELVLVTDENQFFGRELLSFYTNNDKNNNPSDNTNTLEDIKSDIGI